MHPSIYPCLWFDNNAKAAAKHLRLKRGKTGNRVKTVIDFIEKIASRSSMSGEHYKIVYANGKTLLVREFYEKLKQISSKP